MPSLTRNVVGAVDCRRVKVFFADRAAVRYWNDNREATDLRFFGGWYWYIETNGKADRQSDNGPFRSESAAYRDAFMRNALKQLADEDVPKDTRGTGGPRKPREKKATPKRGGFKNAQASLAKARKRFKSG